MGIAAFFLKRRGVGIETVAAQDLAPTVRDGLIAARAAVELQTVILQRALTGPADKLEALQNITSRVKDQALDLEAARKAAKIGATASATLQGISSWWAKDWQNTVVDMQNAWTVMTTRIEAANWLTAVADIERKYKAHKTRIQNELDNVTSQARIDRDEAILALKYIQKTLRPAIRDQEAHQRALDYLGGKITDATLIGPLQTRNTQLLQNIQDIRNQLLQLEQQRDALHADIKKADDKFDELIRLARRLRTTRRGKEWDALWTNFSQATSAFWRDFKTNKIGSAYLTGMSQISARIAACLAALALMPIQNVTLSDAERRAWFAASAQVYEAIASMMNALLQEDTALNNAGMQTPVAGATRTNIAVGNTADLQNAVNVLRARAAAARNCA